MLRLIERAAASLPRPVHRMALRWAHRLRNRWRRLVGMPLEGVSIILRNDAGEVLLVRHSYAGRRWTLPGGGVHRGEPPEQTARREMREELGCGLHDLALLRVMHERISGSPHTAHIFTARSADPVNVDGREVTEAAWFRPDALPDGMGPIARARLSALLEQR